VQSTAPEPAPAPVEEAAGTKESKPAARKSSRLKVETAAAADAAGEEWSPSASDAKERAPRKKAAPRGRKAASDETPAAEQANGTAPSAVKEEEQAPAETGVREERAEPAAAASESTITYSESGVP